MSILALLNRLSWTDERAGLSGRFSKYNSSAQGSFCSLSAEAVSKRAEVSKNNSRISSTM